MTTTDQIARAQQTARGADRAATVLVGMVDGGVALLRADTGATIWRKRAGGEITSLAHGGDIVYLAVSSGRQHDIKPQREPAPFPPAPPTRDASGAPVYERDPTGRRDYHIRMERVIVGFDLARIEARRATDGALLWSYTSGYLPIGAFVTLAGETLIVWAPTLVARQPIIIGLDVASGVPRWRRIYLCGDKTAQDATEEIGPERTSHNLGQTRIRKALGAHDGHFYVEVVDIFQSANTPGPMRVSHWIEALDAASGALIWRHEIDPEAQRALLSWGGALILDIARTSEDMSVVTARRAADGALVGTLAYQGDLRGVSDDGVAYVLEGEAADRRLRALRINGASAERASQGVTQGQPTVICVTRVIRRDRNRQDARLEVAAVDVATGATRWTWRSPKNLATLLRLWGLRAPTAFAASVFRQMRKYGPTLMSGMGRELRAGQWRHPAAMHEYDSRVDAAGDAVYLSGRLGVFALRASDGALRWSGLPNVEVGMSLPPLVSPQEA